MYVRVLTATVFATVASHAQGQQFDTVLDTALVADPQIAGAEAAVRGAEAGVTLGRAVRLPSLGVEAQASLQTSNNLYDANRGRQLGIAATFDLPLYAGGELRWRLRAAEATLAEQVARRDMVVNTRLADTAARYAELARARVVLGARAEQVAGVEDVLVATRERARMKVMTATDVQQGVARLALSRARLAEARAMLVRSGEDLRQITGDYLPRAEEMPPPALPAGLVDALADEVASVPAVRVAAARVDAARAAVGIARASRLPRLSLTSSLESARDPATQALPTAQGYATAMRIGLTLRVPLYQGGGPGARVRQAQQTLAGAMEDRRAAENQVVLDVRSQWAQLRAAERSMGDLVVAVEAGRAALDSVRVQALLGDRTNLDILNAQEEVTQAEVALAEARARRLALAYAILGTMGRLQAHPAPRPLPVRTAARLRFDGAGLWVWNGSATWSLTPGGRASATRFRDRA